MNILLAVEKYGHVFWNRNDYDFIKVDTDSATSCRVSTYEAIKRAFPDMFCGVVEYSFKDDGVYAQAFYCGSGYGKKPMGDPVLVIERNSYDTLSVVQNEAMREAEKRYQGNYMDNSDFFQDGD